MSDYTPTKDRIVSWLMEGAYTGQGADHRAEAFDAWLAEHDAALIEGLADELNGKRNEPGLAHLAVRYAGYYTGLRSGIESSEALLREKARQRREGQS